ncbi:MAG: Bax inhibitor-1/YccA family protein [Bacteroidales bacterium]|jgi:uncharacterized YccA/Bax inhibitor family protein|nr:Bax inhibitor-1/YccA family protein [Bacteroidales bacterium]
MNNPILRDKSFAQSGTTIDFTQAMTIKGTVRKALLLLFMIIAAASYTWKIYYDATNPASITGWMYGGLIVAFVLAMIISFKPRTAPVLSPFYAAGEGFALGGISAMFNQAFAATAPNIVVNTVILTMLCALIMLTVYRKRIVRVTGRFTRIMMLALFSIMAFYLVDLILGLFGVNIGFFAGNSLFSILISFAIVVVAAFSLLMDYDFIVKASEQGYPKYMEWYGAFGLMVTLVWLYIEILNLLGKVSRN